MSDHRRWRIIDQLARQRTVHAVDRRGRGGSGDGPERSPDREVEDVVAVIDALADEGVGHWFGHVEAAPVTMSGWHHHGDNVTMGYVLKGKITLEFGPGGSQKVEVAEGEYFEVPKNTVHREGNTSPESGEVVISRVGQGQLVFPVDGPETA